MWVKIKVSRHICCRSLPQKQAMTSSRCLKGKAHIKMKTDSRTLLNIVSVDILVKTWRK